MKDDIKIAIILLFVGMIIGLFAASMIIDNTYSIYVKKHDVAIKKTIVMEDCYAQYSAVRRFPK